MEAEAVVIRTATTGTVAAGRMMVGTMAVGTMAVETAAGGHLRGVRVKICCKMR